MTEENQYFSIPIEKFRNATRDISFDVYLKVSEDNFAHVFSKTTGLDYQRLAQYFIKGVTELFVLKKDREAFEEFITNTPAKILNDPKTTTEKKVSTLLNMTEQNLSEVFNQVEVGRRDC